MGFIFYFLLIGFFLVELLLILVILSQESKSLGLGASFGGGDAATSLFGTATADVIKKATRILIMAFFIMSIFFSYWCGHITSTPMQQPPMIEEGVE